MPSTDITSVADLLVPERVRVGLSVATKAEAVDALVGLLGGAPAVRDLDAVRQAVTEREALMSTGVGEGLAFPHARTDAVSETVGAFAVTDAPLDYDALDGQPVRLLFLLVGPENARGTHVQLLGRLSRLMSDAAFRARLLDASDADAVLAAFQAEDRA